MTEDSHFRRSARRPVELKVRFRRDLADTEFELSGQLVDLSIGGAQIKCERPPSIGAGLRILLTSPSAWDPLDLPAVVRWIDDDGATFGVEFEPLRGAEATALYELLAASRFAEVKR